MLPQNFSKCCYCGSIFLWFQLSAFLRSVCGFPAFPVMCRLLKGKSGFHRRWNRQKKPLSVLPHVLGQLDNRLDKILLFYSQFLNCDILPSTVFANNCGRTALISVISGRWYLEFLTHSISHSQQFSSHSPRNIFHSHTYCPDQKTSSIPFPRSIILRKRVWWVHFSFPGDYRNLTSPWWNHLVLKLHKHSRCLVGKPGNRIPRAQSPLGAGAARRCRQGRRRPLDPPGTAGLAPQELCYLICSGKWHWELWNPLGRAFSSCQVQTRRGYWVWLCCCWTFVLF